MGHICYVRIMHAARKRTLKMRENILTVPREYALLFLSCAVHLSSCLRCFEMGLMAMWWSSWQGRAWYMLALTAGQLFLSNKENQRVAVFQCYSPCRLV